MEHKEPQNGRGLAEMLQAETKRHIEHERELFPILLGCVQLILGAEVHFCDDTIENLKSSEQWLAKSVAEGNEEATAESQGPEESESEGERLAKETGLGSFGKQLVDKHGIGQSESAEPLPEGDGPLFMKQAVDAIEESLEMLDPNVHRQIVDKYFTERFPKMQADWQQEQQRTKAVNELLNDVICDMPTERLIFLVDELKKQGEALRKSA